MHVTHVHTLAVQCVLHACNMLAVQCMLHACYMHGALVCMCRTKYKGEKGELVRVEYVDGKIDHFKGEKGEEQLVRVEYAVGRVEHYKAKKGKLRLVRVENAVGHAPLYTKKGR